MRQSRDSDVCSVHEEYIKSISVLNNNVRWLITIGKWIVGALATCTVALIGAAATLNVKANEAYAQIQKNTQAIQFIMEGKTPHGH